MHTLILMMALMQTKAATPVQKYYITGLGHTATANDCTIPPIVAYGSSRLDALTHCCEGGGLTVWTEAEYSAMRQTIGKAFDASCAASKSKPEPIDVPADTWPVLIHAAGDTWGCGLMACYTEPDIYELRPDCRIYPDRVLIGPNGKGEWFCHLPQTM